MATCPSSHPLVLRTAGGFNCDVCRAQSQAGEQAMRCFPCDYDKCIECYARDNAIKCQRGHALLKSLLPKFTCSKCKSVTAHKAFAVVCQACDVTLCQRCVFGYTKKKSKRNELSAKESAQLMMSNLVLSVLESNLPHLTYKQAVAHKLETLMELSGCQAAKFAFDRLPFNWSAALECENIGAATSTQVRECSEAEDDGSSFLHREVVLGRLANVEVLLDYIRISSNMTAMRPNRNAQMPCHFLTAKRYLALANLSNATEVDFTKIPATTNQSGSPGDEPDDRLPTFLLLIRLFIKKIHDGPTAITWLGDNIMHHIIHGDLATIILWCHMLATQTPATQCASFLTTFTASGCDSNTPVTFHFYSDRLSFRTLLTSVPRRRFGYSAMSLAVMHNRLDILRFLGLCGFDPNPVPTAASSNAFGGVGGLAGLAGGFGGFGNNGVSEAGQSLLIEALQLERLAALKPVKGSDLAKWFQEEIAQLTERTAVARVLVNELGANTDTLIPALCQKATVMLTTLSASLVKLTKPESAVVLAFPFINRTSTTSIFDLDCVAISDDLAAAILEATIPQTVLAPLLMLLEFENAFPLLGQEFIMTNVYASLAAVHLKLLSSCRATVPADMLQLFPQQTKLVSDVATCYQLSFPQQPSVVATGPTPTKESQLEPSLLFSSIAVQKIVSAVIDPYQAQLFLDLTIRQSTVTLLKVVLAAWAVQEHHLNPTRSSPIIHDYTSGSNIDERRGDDEFDQNVACVIVKPKRDFRLNTLLHLACELGLTPVVEFLIDTVNRQQAEGHYGRACGTSLDSNSNLAKGVKVLLDLAPGHSAALSPLLTVVEARNQDRMSALQLAIRSTAALTAPDVVRLLLVKGSASMSSYETYFNWLQLRENVRIPSYFAHTKSLPTSPGKVEEGIASRANTGFFKSLPYPTKTNANPMNVAFAVASFGNLEALVDGLCSRDYEQSAAGRIPSSLEDGTLVAFLWRATKFISTVQALDVVQQKQCLSILRKLVALGCSLNISPDLPTLYQLKADTNLDPMNPQDMNVPPLFLGMVVALLTRNAAPVSGFGGGIPQVSPQMQTFGNELVTILLDAGADPDEKDRSGSPISALWPTGDIMRYRKLVA